MMPQKRNPDAAELVRAKTGRVIGALTALLVVMKGLPLAYAKDMQEDKEGAMDALAALALSIAAMTGMVRRSRARRRAHEEGGRRRLRHRHRSRRLAGAHAENAVPRRPSRHRPHRRQGGGSGRAAAPAAACRHAGDRAANQRGRVQRAFGRPFGEKPDQFRRHRAQKRARAGEEMAAQAGKRANPELASSRVWPCLPGLLWCPPPKERVA